MVRGRRAAGLTCWNSAKWKEPAVKRIFAGVPVMAMRKKANGVQTERLGFPGPEDGTGADDFAISDGNETPPTDLITAEAWHGIMDIAGDVAIRTTSHQGSRVALLHELCGTWLEACLRKA